MLNSWPTIGHEEVVRSKVGSCARREERQAPALCWVCEVAHRGQLEICSILETSSRPVRAKRETAVGFIVWRS
eukprot:6515740-Pyramimonas_sp.AAC.1